MNNSSWPLRESQLFVSLFIDNLKNFLGVGRKAASVTGVLTTEDVEMSLQEAVDSFDFLFFIFFCYCLGHGTIT